MSLLTSPPILAAAAGALFLAGAAQASDGQPCPLPALHLAQASSGPASSQPQSATDPREPGEPSAAAQPPQEGHAPPPIPPSEQTPGSSGQPAQAVPPGHKPVR